MKRSVTFIVRFLVPALVFVESVSGAVISVNFQGGRSPSATGPAVTGTAGFLQVGNWNNSPASSLTGNPITGSLANLIDDVGSSTGASVSWATWNPWDLQSGDGNGGDEDLMSGYLDNLDVGTSSLIISNIPYSEYDVYVYFNRGVATYTGLTATDGSNSDTFYAKDTGANFPLGGGSSGYIISTDDTVDTNDSSWTPANVFKFSDFTGSTLSFSDPANPGIPSVPGTSWKVYIQGIQIVGIPEPSRVMLLCLGVLAFALRRRRN